MKLLSQIVTGIDIPCEVKVGRRLLIEHFGGIVVSGDAVIGDDVVLRHGVTVGLRRTEVPGIPDYRESGGYWSWGKNSWTYY